MIQHLPRIAFPRGHTARAVLVSPGASGAAISEALAIPPPGALLILNGGTAPLEDPVAARLAAALQQGVAAAVCAANLTVLTGGTNAGIFALFGAGLAQQPCSSRCVGVAPAVLVTIPGQQKGEADLEPHYTDFILVEGDDWGDETATMYRVAAALSARCPSLALFAGGGEITIREMQANVAQRRPMILLAGSGRATGDVLAALGGAPLPDPRLLAIARSGLNHPFAIAQPPGRLRDLIRDLLADHHGPGGAAL